MISLTLAIRGGLRRCAIQIDVYFTLLYFCSNSVTVLHSRNIGTSRHGCLASSRKFPFHASVFNSHQPNKSPSTLPVYGVNEYMRIMDRQTNGQTDRQTDKTNR